MSCEEAVKRVMAEMATLTKGSRQKNLFYRNRILGGDERNYYHGRVSNFRVDVLISLIVQVKLKHICNKGDLIKRNI